MRLFYPFSLVCILLLFFSTTTFAQKRIIHGFIGDSFTKEGLPKTSVFLLSPDSTIIDTTISNTEHENKWLQSSFSLKVTSEGNYILRFIREGYITTYKDITTKFSKRSDTYQLDKMVLMRKDPYYLREVTVTTTKVKMVVRGDTVVYNADAFQLVQGSMLDDLVKQLPGVEIKSDGRIYERGKFVESLLINGKDFFKGDPKIALDNLPAYMVKSVKVFNKTNTYESGDKGHLVMDVNLQNQYSIGWISNVEDGRGTHDLYIERLFAMRFTNNSRLALFCNVNNMNDTRKPGYDSGEWQPSSMPDGLLKSQTAGLSYLLSTPNEAFEAWTDNMIEHRDADSRIQKLGETFLSGGNTFNRFLSFSRNNSTKFTTQNGFESHLIAGTYLAGSWNMSYNKFDNQINFINGNFSSNPMNTTGDSVLDSLFSKDAGYKMKEIIINRNKAEQKVHGYEMKHTGILNYSVTTNKLIGDTWNIHGNIDYSSLKNESFDHYVLDYPSNAALPSDYRNRYYHQPVSKYELKLGTDYNYCVYNHNSDKGGKLSINPQYEYIQTYRSAESLLYRLDTLTDWGLNGIHTLGMLPSSLDSLQLAIDNYNSYHSTVHNSQHVLNMFVIWMNNLNHGEWPNENIFEVQTELKFRHERDALHYYRNGKNFPLTRNAGFFEPDIRLRYQTPKFGCFRLEYIETYEMPPSTYMIDIRDNSDPLNISLGNPDLKNAHLYTAKIQYDRSPCNDNLFTSLQYRIIKDVVSMGFVYDRATGIRTISPENINGNWGITARCQWNKSFEKEKKFTFDTNYMVDYNTNVDVVSISGAYSSTRSSVHNMYMNEVLRLDYRLNSKLQVGTKIGADWTRASSHRSDFETINAEAFDYGITGQLEFPWNVQIATDLTMYSRRGYQDSSMNTNEFVWNGRISKSVMHGNLTFMFDGFDILGNLSNVRRTLNAQGRTETYYNVIPRYAMFHAIYRLNIQPKKKK